jgi:monoamine oxidase
MGRYSWMPDQPPERTDPADVSDPAEDVFYCPETVLAPRRDGGGKSICVIGAGIAGLVAAYELLQAGHSVTIVEAEHRVGGRVRTWYSGGVNGELGPMRVPPKHRGTMHYMKEMGFQPDPFVQRNAAAWLALRDAKVRRAAWQRLLPLYGPKAALFRMPVLPGTPVEDVLAKAEDLAGITMKGVEAWRVMSGSLGPKAQQLASMTLWEAITVQWGALGIPLLTNLGWELVGQATSSIREERISALEAWIEGAWTFGPEARYRLVEGMEALPRALRGRGRSSAT